MLPQRASSSSSRYISLAGKGRHRIHVEDDQAPAFRQWMDTQPEGQRDECLLALGMSLELDAREPSRHEVRVAAVAESLWTGDPPRLTLQDAHDLLRRRYEIVVEDADSDRAFLLAMATPEQRDFLEKHEGNDHLLFRHGGGISKIRQAITEHKQRLGGRLGCFVLFDSDALRPQQPSAQSQEVATLCEEAPTLAHHRLARRNIENYLPRDALRGHVHRPPPRRRPHVATFDSFVRMRDEQRFHYNMKRGFAGDGERTDGSAGDLYDDLTDAARTALERGFGDTIGRLFKDGNIQPLSLRVEGGWQEINPLVCEIIAMIR